MATASKKREEGEGETITEEVIQEDGTKVIVKKTQQRRAQAPSNQEGGGFDSDDGFMKASDKRKIAPREK